MEKFVPTVILRKQIEEQKKHIDELTKLLELQQDEIKELKERLAVADQNIVENHPPMRNRKSRNLRISNDDNAAYDDEKETDEDI